MSTIYFTSDLHLGHRLVAGHRGFGEDIAAHDSAICDNWIETVKRDDIVWVLGDLCMSDPAYALSLIHTLPGRKRLIFGNHDSVHPMHRRADKHLAAHLDVFEYVAPFARASVQGIKVLLSHFPYDEEGGDRGENRYRQWRLPNLGEILLHGHTHMADQREHGRQVHVGLDAWDLKPVSVTTIHEIIREWA